MNDKVILAVLKSSNFNDSVKRVIREEVSNELFWRNLITDINFDSKINSVISSKVPSLVKEKTDKIVSKAVSLLLKDYSRIELPILVETLVMKELRKQVVSFLNDSSQMNQILNNHSLVLNAKLEKSARELLDKIVNEDKYHEITNCHLAGIDRKCNEFLKCHKEHIDEQLDSNDKKFKSQMNEMNTCYNSNMLTLKKKLDVLELLNSKTNELQATVTRQETKITILMWTVGVMGVLLSSATLLNFYLIGN